MSLAVVVVCLFYVESRCSIQLPCVYSPPHSTFAPLHSIPLNSTPPPLSLLPPFPLFPLSALLSLVAFSHCDFLFPFPSLPLTQCFKKLRLVILFSLVSPFPHFSLPFLSRFLCNILSLWLIVSLSLASYTQCWKRFRLMILFSLSLSLSSYFPALSFSFSLFHVLIVTYTVSILFASYAVLQNVSTGDIVFP